MLLLNILPYKIFAKSIYHGATLNKLELSHIFRAGSKIALDSDIIKNYSFNVYIDSVEALGIYYDSTKPNHIDSNLFKLFQPYHEGGFISYRIFDAYGNLLGSVSSGVELKDTIRKLEYTRKESPIQLIVDTSLKLFSTKSDNYNLHFQSTYIYQYQPPFSAKYSSINSLKTAEDKENSITATLYLGIKLWRGAEVYINPEVAGGSGLSGAYGLAASSNGETFRIGDPAPTLYLARGYISQYFPIGIFETSSYVTEGVNEVGGAKYNNYIKFYLGKLSLADIFDNNIYSNSPPTQFLNWCLMNNGAWDFAANLRGYTYAFATVLQKGNMDYKFALAAMPVTANGLDLNTNLNQEYSLNGEVDRTYNANGGKYKGNIRFLGYYNNGHMGNYRQAMLHLDSAGLPNVISTRQYGRTKIGLGISFGSANE